MGKRPPKEKCEHGLSPVYMQGCPHCVMTAMDALNLLRFIGITVEDLQMLLTHQWGTAVAIREAMPAAKENWARLESARNGVEKR